MACQVVSFTLHDKYRAELSHFEEGITGYAMCGTFLTERHCAWQARNWGGYTGINRFGNSNCHVKRHQE